MDKIKILVVDDHPMMREAMLTALNEEADMQVVGECVNGIEAIKFCEEHDPDVILMDLLMPGMNGLEAIIEIRKIDPQARILVVTSLEDEEKVLAAIQAGALGYFPKTAPRAFLLEAIRKVADGIPYLPSGLALKLFKGLREMGAGMSPAKSEADESLTSRQEEILALLSEGHSDQEIGRILTLKNPPCAHICTASYSAWGWITARRPWRMFTVHENLISISRER